MSRVIAAIQTKVLRRIIWYDRDLYEWFRNHSRFYHSSNVNEQLNVMVAEHRQEHEGNTQKKEALLELFSAEKKRANKNANRCLEIIDSEAPPKTAKAMQGPVFLHLTAIYEKAGGKLRIPSNLEDVEEKFGELVRAQVEQAKGNPSGSRLAQQAFQRHTEFLHWIEVGTQLYDLSRKEQEMRKRPVTVQPETPVGGSAYGAFVKEGDGSKQVYDKASPAPAQKSKEELEMEDKKKRGLKSFYDSPWGIQGGDDEENNGAEVPS